MKDLFSSGYSLITGLSTQVRLDYDGGENPIYIGWADPDAKTGDTIGFRICKLTWDANGNPTSLHWANGKSVYDKEWDNRATYDYTPDA